MEKDLPFRIRKSARLKDYDYSSQNYYFITICTHEKQCLFGTNQNLNELGKIAYESMAQLSSHYQGVIVEHFIIMPNHVHAVIAIEKEARERVCLINILGNYKSGVSRKIHQIKPGLKIWQRSFHDHIIRNRADYEKICNYVYYNYLKWENDCFFPENQKP